MDPKKALFLQALANAQGGKGKPAKAAKGKGKKQDKSSKPIAKRKK